MAGDKHFNADKIFLALFVFTALEVGWGWLARDWGKPMLWGGLMFFAFLKGWLIAVYFMHLKFEGWVIYSLLIPTLPLILVIFGYVLPDVADKESNLVHPVGSMLDAESGAVIHDLELIGDHGGSEESGGH